MLPSEKICWDCLSRSFFPVLRKEGYKILNLSNVSGGCFFIVEKEGRKTEVTCSKDECEYSLERAVLIGNKM